MARVKDLWFSEVPVRERLGEARAVHHGDRVRGAPRDDAGNGRLSATRSHRGDHPTRPPGVESACPGCTGGSSISVLFCHAKGSVDGLTGDRLAVLGHAPESDTDLLNGDTFAAPTARKLGVVVVEPCRSAACSAFWRPARPARPGSCGEGSAGVTGQCGMPMMRSRAPLRSSTPAMYPPSSAGLSAGPHSIA